MCDTQQFKGFARPGIELTCAINRMPHSTPILNSVNESQVKQRKEVCQLTYGLNTLFSIFWILAYHP